MIKLNPNLTKSQQLKSIALDSYKSSQSLIGKQVKYIGEDYIKKQLTTGDTYTISDISSGNYDSFIKLKELADTRYSEYSRTTVQNTYNIEEFELA
ncbi:hypothetical protein [Cytobacillus gottheilii]|uniref:hypothetical protein n=1 Tax=Cytobacillus gottheilii TaxID=859144 RepID=UPI0009B9B2EA|nr:hypothetical protein [Cytobacillus gottheilii]